MTTESTPARMWKGRPTEARVAARREQLVDAAIELLGTLGSSGVTMRGVCRQAELSPRYFYESFEDRDALMIAAFDRALEAVTAVVADAITTSNEPVQQLLAAVNAGAAMIQQDRVLGQILFREPYVAGPLGEHSASALNDFLIAVLGGLEIPGARLAVDDPLRQGYQLAALSGAVAALFRAWTDETLGDDRESFSRFVVDFLVTSLSEQPNRRPDGASMDHLA